MTIEEFAQSIDGKEYGYKQFTESEIQTAKENGWVIVCGASDDLMEFDGALMDEGDCYDGGIIRVNKDGISSAADDKYIEALWCENVDGSKSDIAWQYHTEIPHVTFMIYEDGEPYCKAIVFDIKDLN